jgi:hypothetical protein
MSEPTRTVSISVPRSLLRELDLLLPALAAREASTSSAALSEAGYVPSPKVSRSKAFVEALRHGIGPMRTALATTATEKPNGLAAVVGQWPGDESDEEVRAALAAVE